MPIIAVSVAVSQLRNALLTFICLWNFFCKLLRKKAKKSKKPPHCVSFFHLMIIFLLFFAPTWKWELRRYYCYFQAKCSFEEKEGGTSNYFDCWKEFWKNFQKKNQKLVKYFKNEKFGKKFENQPFWHFWLF